MSKINPESAQALQGILLKVLTHNYFDDRFEPQLDFAGMEDNRITFEMKFSLLENSPTIHYPVAVKIFLNHDADQKQKLLKFVSFMVPEKKIKKMETGTATILDCSGYYVDLLQQKADKKKDVNNLSMVYEAAFLKFPQNQEVANAMILVSQLGNTNLSNPIQTFDNPTTNSEVFMMTVFEMARGLASIHKKQSDGDFYFHKNLTLENIAAFREGGNFFVFFTGFDHFSSYKTWKQQNGKIGLDTFAEDLHFALSKPRSDAKIEMYKSMISKEFTFTDNLGPISSKINWMNIPESDLSNDAKQKMGDQTAITTLSSNMYEETAILMTLILDLFNLNEANGFFGDKVDPRILKVKSAFESKLYQEINELNFTANDMVKFLKDELKIPKGVLKQKHYDPLLLDYFQELKNEFGDELPSKVGRLLKVADQKKADSNPASEQSPKLEVEAGKELSTNNRLLMV